MEQNNTKELVALIGILHQQSKQSEEREKLLIAEFKALKDKLEDSKPCPEIRREWIPREELKNYLQFADTQMSAITKQYGITYTEIGKRKFYSSASIKKILESHKKN
jgi:hypothetical protein